MPFRNPIGAISELIADSLIGAYIATAAAGNRWVLSSPGAANTIEGFTDDPKEYTPATIRQVSIADSARGNLTLLPPHMLNADNVPVPTGSGFISLLCDGNGTPGFNRIRVAADRVELGPPTTEPQFTGNETDVSIDPAGVRAVTIGGTGLTVNSPATLLGSLNVSGATALAALATSGMASLNGGAAITGNLSVSGTISPGTIDFDGDTITKLRYGVSTVVVGAGASTADLAVPHGRGNAPTIAIATALNVTTFYANIASLTAVNVNLRVAQRDGVAGAANVQVAWLAIWA